VLSILEHSSPRYPPRTYHNARAADLTVAIALDFNTAGERLTHNAAGHRYLAIPLSANSQQAAESLLEALREHRVRTLNVAGNGIYTLASRGWTQERANRFVYTLLSQACPRWLIENIISGGQTGIDLAGVTAAYALGIPACATLPQGFIQRGIDNRDCSHVAHEIREQIEWGAAQLRAGVEHSLKFRTPRLLNIQRETIPPDAAYIGRGRFRGQTSKVGNPFVIGPDGDREMVCDKFEAWAPTQPQVMAAIDELRGRDLACYCTPYRCHGDFILRMANCEGVATPASSAAAIGTNTLCFDPQI